MTTAAPAREHPERVQLDTLRERLAALGLHHAAGALSDHISDGVKHDRPAHAVLPNPSTPPRRVRSCGAAGWAV